MKLSDRNMAHWTDIYIPLSYPGSGDNTTSSAGTPGDLESGYTGEMASTGKYCDCNYQ